MDYLPRASHFLAAGSDRPSSLSSALPNKDWSMKYLLLTLSLLSLVACQDSAPNTGAKAGYVAGYQLTCGLSWSAGNRFVVDKEFARDFLDGAIVCAREHPERARRVLGLAERKQTALATKTDKSIGTAAKKTQQLNPIREEAPKQKESPAPVRHPSNAPRVSAKTAKAPANPPKASRRAVNASAKKTTPVNAAKAPDKTTRAPTKSAKAPPRSTEAPAPAKAAPVSREVSVKATEPTVRSVDAPAPTPEIHMPSVEDTSGKRQRPKSRISDYERFMGRR